MSRPTKLDSVALQQIRQAARRGLSEREIQELLGICERTWFNWKARAKAAAALMPAEWRRLPLDELVACAKDLGIDLSRQSRSGRKGCLTRGDLIRVLVDRAELYRSLIVELQSARVHAKVAILERLEPLMNGTAQRRRTRTTQRVRYLSTDGSPSSVPTGDAIVVTEVVELPPDRQVLLKVLERLFPAECSRCRCRAEGRARPIEIEASRLAELVRQMLATVPPPP